jgi:hypothetical protein
MIDFNDELPRSAHMYPILLAHINSSLNPVLYAFTNGNFKKGYRNLYFCLFERKKYVFTIGLSSNNKTLSSKTNNQNNK